PGTLRVAGPSHPVIERLANERRILGGKSRLEAQRPGGALGEDLRVDVAGGVLLQLLQIAFQAFAVLKQQRQAERQGGDHSSFSPRLYFFTASISIVTPRPGLSGIASMPSASSVQPPATISST